MKFNIGMKVEVLTKKKALNGAWRCAEIMADNGDSYMVRYYRRPGVLSEVVEKVSAPAVRPCPPRGNVPLFWAVGDIVEVLDNGYWKTAEIREVMEGGCYHIHLVGSIDEFRVEKSSIRECQEWQHGKWSLIEKDSGICKGMLSRTPKKDHMQDVVKSTVSKSRKRLWPNSSAPDEALAECVLKRRVVEKDDFAIIHGDSYSFIGKVDILAHPRKNQVKDNVQTLSQKAITYINHNHKSQDDANCLSRTSGSKDCIGTMSSVASCSISCNCDRVLSHSSAGCSQDGDSLCSDAESSVHFGDEEGTGVCQSKGEYDLRAHEMDLDTYRKILEGLYASGPLSWKQEAILTNLRIKLYVSNDEHLMELRRLKSTGNFYVSCR